MVHMSFDAETGRASLDKDVSQILIDSFSIESASTETLDGETITSVTLHPHGSVTISRKGGKYSISALDCSVSITDSPDKKSYIQTIRPGHAPD